MTESSKTQTNKGTPRLSAAPIVAARTIATKSPFFAQSNQRRRNGLIGTDVAPLRGWPPFGGRRNRGRPSPAVPSANSKLDGSGEPSHDLRVNHAKSRARKI